MESCLEIVEHIIREFLDKGNLDLESVEPSQWDDLDRGLGKAPSDWTEEEFREAKTLIQMTRKFLIVDHQLMQDLLGVLSPFITQVRRTFLEQGWVRFDSLLARARTLLRDHVTIREELKREYCAILVDEFQDTDPIQYEIILFLAERTGDCKLSWENVELDPGKLFIVGDPKQSIYAFRRADIEAFDQVVQKIQESGGAVYDLVTNFRSHEKVLEVVNAIFDRLFIPKAFVQPANVPLVACPNRQSSARSPGVEIHLVRASDEREDMISAAATRREADRLARWLKEELFEHERVRDANGHETRIQPGHVGLLFRKLTQAQDYLEALRRYEIPYVSDGEKHFYRRQEVIDLINLLRAVSNPYDTIALVGVLRSPIGGVSDRELTEMYRKKALDYRHSERLKDWGTPKAETVRELFERLTELNRQVSMLPLPDAVDVLFARLPILELAACSLHNEQAVVNLLKVRHIAGELADRPDLTLTGFVDLMVERLETQPDEAESALVEESLEAVRILTIHKAKGLEFPVVILPGLQHSANPSGRDLSVSHDWSSGIMGMSVSNRCSLGALLTGEKFKVREEAERRRLLYVGMTRAKERLILSGGLTNRSSSGTFLGMLQGVLGEGLGEPEQTIVHIGESSLSQTVVTRSEGVHLGRHSIASTLTPSPDIATFIRRNELRDQAWKITRSSSDRLTPSQLSERDRQVSPSRGDDHSSDRGRLVGTLAHRVLEAWDFGNDNSGIEELTEVMCKASIPSGLGHERYDIKEELKEMLRHFIASDSYRELCRSKIMAREIPFSIPWKVDDNLTNAVSTVIMEGVIDLLYEIDGQVWVADYKTDWVTHDTIPSRVAAYREQALIYRKAVSECVGLDSVGCKLFFLRIGHAVSV